jgi:hypothetical protein
MQSEGASFPDAVQRLAAKAGITIPGGGSSGADKARRQRKRDRLARLAGQRRIAAERKQEREHQRKIEWAVREAATGKAATPGSDAERWLTGYFGTDRLIPYNAPYPSSLRYGQARHAIMAMATDANGQITGGQRIYLTPAGPRMTKAEAVAAGHKAPKETFGVISGSAVELPWRGPSLAWLYSWLPVRFITESIEAAASVWQITGQETCATLGVGNLRGGCRHGYANVVCLDDDPRGSAAWKQANRAIRAAGFVVLIVNTWEVRRGDKGDLNDILRQCGLDGPAMLRARLDATIFPIKPARRTRIDRDDALKKIRAAAERFARRVSVGDKTLSDVVYAIRADTGATKSAIMRELIPEVVRARRRLGDTRPVICFMPRIDLCVEQAEKMRQIASDLSIRVWEGRDQPGMCQNPGAVKEADRRMLSTQRCVCESGCPFAVGCNYEAQREQQADVWFVAHPLLFTKPAETLRDPLMIWADETAIDAALIGTTDEKGDNPPLMLPTNVLQRVDPVVDPVRAHIDTQRLTELRTLAASVIATMPVGDFTAAPFRSVGLTADMCLEALNLERATKVWPQYDQPISAADRNLDLRARLLFWTGLASLLGRSRDITSGWLRLMTDPNGEPVIRIRGRRKVHKEWRGVPTILTDASFEIELARFIWRDVQLVVDAAVQMPHQHITQVVDRSYSLSMLDADDLKIADDPHASPRIRRWRKAERNRRRRNLRDVHAKLHQQARLAAPGVLLAVAQKRIVDQLQASGSLPSNVEWLHHGAVSGKDDYRTCSRIVLIGRQAPAPAAMEAAAEALTGIACTKLPAGEWYQRADALHELADGRLVATEADLHPDRIAELFRRRSMVQEPQQIIGRGRGMWRDAGTPLHVLVLTDVPLDLPTEVLAVDAAERASFEDKQIAAGGIAFECAAHASRVYPELWWNEERAQYARRLYARGQPAGTIAWLYQVAGQGGKPWLCFALAEMTAAAVEQFLTAKFGPLSMFALPGAQPKGASNQQGKTPPVNSMHFGVEDLPARPVPFAWEAWKPWGVYHPP